ncbi:UPF0175 family protein [Candidatus Micrarchaeota archaeon]|nr:UPF0175 family protein [Candidatus Micrarchaeota archaeon]
MKTVSLRLEESQLARLEKVKGFLPATDSSFVFRYVLEKGLSKALLEKAIEEYVNGRATTAKAAEIAGLSLREMNAELARRGVSLHYGQSDLEEDLHA